MPGTRGPTQQQQQGFVQRYNQQQGPMASAMAHNYGRGSEANYGDYTDIMNRYRDIYGGGGAFGGGGGGATGYSASTIGYKDPFKSYEGYTDFSKTGGYSPEDLANMRSRGISPIRASYANAQREMSRGRTLQGGYSPNMVAGQARMAREQGQSAADAAQNVEAGLAESRNRGRLAGLGGMSDIEKQRLAADLEVEKFNAQAQMQAAASHASASASNASFDRESQLAALRGMTQLYGATPGMSELFGNQLLQAVGQGGQFGMGMSGHGVNAATLPGGYETVRGYIGDAAQAAGPVMDWWDSRKKRQPTNTGGYDYSGAGIDEYTGG